MGKRSKPAAPSTSAPYPVDDPARRAALEKEEQDAVASMRAEAAAMKRPVRSATAASSPEPAIEPSQEPGSAKLTGKRVAVLDPNGNFGTIDEADIPNLPAAARVLTRQQETERKLEEEYDAKSTGQKVVQALTGHGAGPSSEAFLEGGRKTFSAGISQAASRVAQDAIAPGAGKAYAEHLSDLEEGKPGATTAGEAAGLAAGIATGMAGGASAGAGVARALPFNAAAALGAPVEHGLARALGGVAAKGAVGRAVAGGATAVARGAAEGAALAGVEQLSNDVTHDQPITGEKIYGALGSGLLMGGAIAGGFHVAGGLLSAGAKGVARAGKGLSRARPEGPKPEFKTSIGAEQPAEGATVPEAAPRRAASPSVEGGLATAPKRQTEGLGIDPDAGLSAPSPGDERPIRIANLRTRDLFTDAGSARRVQLTDDISSFDSPPATQKAIVPRMVEDLSPLPGGSVPDASVRQGIRTGQSILKLDDVDTLSNWMTRRLETSPEAFGPGVSAAPEGRASLARAVKPRGDTMAAWTDAVAGDSAAAPSKGFVEKIRSPEGRKSLANKMAWDAISKDRGISSVYAKRAEKYLPNGVEDIGETFMRKGIIPTDKGWFEAAKNGTPADMLARAEAEEALNARKIGELTQASGARINVKDINGIFNEVRSSYDKYAGYEHVVDAIDNYQQSLLSKLNPVDGSVSVQDILAQRKKLDDLIYKENKTLDPKSRVEALRVFRGKLEGLTIEAMDQASGRLTGQLAKEYRGLKRDHVALSIGLDALRDGAARMEKAGLFNMKDMVAGAMAGGLKGLLVSSAHKIVRERGSATAAAMLYRSAETGSISNVVSKFDQQAARAAKGVLVPPQKGTSKGATPTTAKPELTTRAKAQMIARSVIEANSQPQKFLDRVDQSTESLALTNPNAAASFKATAMRGLSLLYRAIPENPPTDPLMPNRSIRMTDTEAAKLVRTAEYVARPVKFFEDVERGKVTPEGVAVAKELMPEAYAEFQVKMLDTITEHLSRGKQIPYAQRLKVGVLLDIPADASLRPERMTLLQSNVSTPPLPPEAEGGQPGPSNPPVNLPTQQSVFDRLTENGPGR